jgi:hypothetical protein
VRTKRPKRKAFDVNVHNKLVDSFKYEDYQDDPDVLNANTLTYDAYENENDGAYAHIPDIDDDDPDTINCHIKAEAELSIGDKIMPGKAQRHRRNANGFLKGDCLQASHDQYANMINTRSLV